MKKISLKWEQMRYAFLRFLNRRVARTAVGTIPPNWLQFIYYLLFPLNYLYERNSHVKYNCEMQCFTIDGVSIHQDVFKWLKVDGAGVTLKTDEFGTFCVKEYLITKPTLGCYKFSDDIGYLKSRLTVGKEYMFSDMLQEEKSFIVHWERGVLDKIEHHPHSANCFVSGNRYYLYAREL